MYGYCGNSKPKRRYDHRCPGCGANQGRWANCKRHIQTCCPDLLEGARVRDCRIVERQDHAIPYHHQQQQERLPNVYKCPGCGAVQGKWSNCKAHMRSCIPDSFRDGNRVTLQQCLASYEEAVQYVAMSGGGGATRRAARTPRPAPRNDRPGVNEAFYYYHRTAAEEERAAAAAAFGARMRADMDKFPAGYPTSSWTRPDWGRRIVERTPSIDSEEKNEKRKEVGVVGESLGNASTLARGASPGSEPAGMNADDDPIAGGGSEQVGLEPVQEIGWSLFHVQIKSPCR